MSWSVLKDASEQAKAEMGEDAPTTALLARTQEIMDAWRESPRIKALEADNARFREALEQMISTHDQGHSPCFCIEARAALSGDKRE